jgi:hypothetical protein
VLTFKQATGEPDDAAATSTAQWQARQGGQDQTQVRPGREYWEKREARRESSILLQVAFKAAIALQASKINAGQAEDRQWLYNTALEFYDWMEGQITKEPSSPVRQAQSAGRRGVTEETGNDEILF